MFLSLKILMQNYRIEKTNKMIKVEQIIIISVVKEVGRVGVAI